MVLSSDDRKRAEELARELVKITDGRYNSDGKSKTFGEIEGEAIELGDLITSIAINPAVEQAPDAPPQCRCPECGATPKKRGPDDDEPVILETPSG